MDPSEFPPLTADPSMDSSWAHVNNEEENTEASTHGTFINSEDKPTYAETAGQEQRNLEASPTPQEQVQGKPLPEITYDYAPPNPTRSYADAASNEGFPTLEEANQIEEPKSNDLSQLPDVKEMLDGPSVTPISPPPAAISFAKIAARPAASPSPPSPPVSPRKLPNVSSSSPKEKEQEIKQETEKDIIKEEEEKEEKDNVPPSIDDHEEFPSLSSSTEINNDNNRTTTANNNNDQGSDLTQSYSQITQSGLDQAPPSAVSKMDAQPVYNEDDFMAESAKREVRKWNQLQNNGETENITPEMSKLQNEQIEKEEEVKKEEQEENENKAKQHTINHKNKFTLIDTASRLRDNGYSWLTAIPTAFFLHLRYSPFTSPYRFPFIYRSLSDILLLPIYTQKLRDDLVKKNSHLLLQGSTQDLDASISKYGTKQGHVIGLKLNDGFRLLKEKEHLHWWQYGSWASHRLQWMFLYMVLEDSNSHLVTSESLLSLKQN
ncbi:hypothetical protein BJ944DRAFT_265563 [Cunninghamella echinulata]|nr:hypothetical protein BJ944DRAFT_265563 [Cunninghamella echinulata]